MQHVIDKLDTKRLLSDVFRYKDKDKHRCLRFQNTDNFQMLHRWNFVGW